MPSRRRLEVGPPWRLGAPRYGVHMNLRLVRAALGAMVALALLGRPVGAQSASPSPAASPVPPASGLQMAVSFAALGTTSILYSDWAAMKATHGAADITSATPIDERLAAIVQLTRSEAPFAAFALSHFRGHAEAWGWDTSDLDWEASLQGDGPPVAVLRFRHGFDLDPVAGHMDARGFSTTDYGDAVIRSHDLATAGGWVGTTNFGILNTAFLGDGHTLVLSSSVDALKAALDARNVMTYRAEPAFVVAGALGDPLSAGIEIGPDACHAFDPRGLPGDDGKNDALHRLRRTAAGVAGDGHRDRPDGRRRALRAAASPSPTARRPMPPPIFRAGFGWGVRA